MGRGGNFNQTLGLPSNIEAEQALLGSLLFDNSALHTVAGLVKAAHFYEPFHQRLFYAIERRVHAGQRADPITLQNLFASDPAWDELGGIRYLADLLDRAPPAPNAPDYARAVAETAGRRALIRLGNSLSDGGWNTDVAVAELMDGALQELAQLTAAAEDLRLTDADTAMDQVLDFLDNPGSHPDGTLTGLQPLDDHLGPLLPGDLVVLGGRPGMGKSAKATAIGTNVALGGGGVIEIHAEMGVAQVWRRRLAASAYAVFAERAPAYSGIRKRTVTYDQRQMLDKARERLAGIPLVATKRSGITLNRLRSVVMRQKAEFAKRGIPLKLVTIDHVGLVKTERPQSTRVDQQTEVSNGMKELADEAGCPVLALAQLSRKTEDRDDKRPQLSDLRDSGSWEQDADLVILAYREAYYAQREKAPDDSTAKGQAAYAEWDQRRRSPWVEAILAKVREGETATKKLWAHMPTNTILGEAPPDDLGGFI